MLAAFTVAGCHGTNTLDGGTPPTDGNPGQPDLQSPVPPVVLKRESRSSAIAISDDDNIVAAVSPDDDRVYLINTTTSNSKVTVQLPAGSEPHSVAFAPDNSFWVANKGTGTVVRIANPDQPSPSLGTPIPVGAEPTGIAISPAGTRVVVTNYVDGNVSILDVKSGKVTNVDVGPNPRAVTITNGGKGNDTAETAYVTLMFGQPIGGGVASEGNDVGRQGIVVPVGLGTGTAGAQIKLAPIANTTFSVPDAATPTPNLITVGAYPNQLQSISINNGKVYVPSTAASPAGPIHFSGNVHPFVSVFDLATGAETKFAPSGANANTGCGSSIANATAGYGAGTLDLAIQARDLRVANAAVLFPTLPVDIAFVPNKANHIGYVVSMASDVITRVVWDYAGNTACAGAPSTAQINLQDVAGKFKVPIGMVISNDQSKGYVNAWVGREVEIIDFSTQSVSSRVALSDLPTVEPGLTLQRGKGVFWTSTGRWSANGWGSCGACHPDGLSDGVTFVFNTGPRQTLPLDSVFGKNADGTLASPTDQRILNWTAIFDEIHDFENNTRGVSGGRGAVVSVGDVQVDFVATGDGNLNGSIRALVADGNTVRPLIGGGTDKVNTTTGGAWTAMERYVQSLRSLHHPAKLDPNSTSAQNGKAQFTKGNCAQCHGGRKWTLSSLNNTPTQGTAAGGATCSQQTTPLAKKSVPTTGAPKPQNTDVFQLQTERPGNKTCAVDADCGGVVGMTCTNTFCTVMPQRLTCSLRSVGTFGAGPQGMALEVRQGTNAAGKPMVAEGATGFNPPSLLSLAATAPYLHNGAAQTLSDLFTNASFSPHLTAGNPNFAPAASEVTDLVNYLLSIDQTTTPPAIDPNFDLCTAAFKVNNNTCTKP